MTPRRSSQDGTARDSALDSSRIIPGVGRHPGYPVLAFDPGASTGVAIVNGNGRVLLTVTLIGPSDLEDFLEFLGWSRNTIDDVVDVVIEVGPQTQHHSPVTRRIEQRLREEYPHAHLVQPGQWKGHPAIRKTARGKARTLHEQDAARLALWRQATRREHDDNTSRATTARTDPKRT